MNTNIKQFAIPLAIIALVLLTIYKVFGSEERVPTREDMKRNSIEQYKEENARIETHNKMTEALCLDEASRIKGAIESARYNLTCLEKNTKPLIDIDKEIAKEYGTGTTTGTLTTGNTVVPERKGLIEDKSLSIECELGVRERKVDGIEFHYTDTVGSTLQSIKKGHENKFGIDHIGYHFVIKENGEITNTRDEKCIAAADKWSENNYRLIQIAFVGKDKPTKEQVESMVQLTRILQKKYNLPLDSVSSHRDWGPKSDKESMTYWFGGVKNFISLVERTSMSEKPTTDTGKVLLRNGEQLDSVNYAWNKWKDMDFILTIDQESRWNPDAAGDVDHPKKGDYAYGYCQYNSAWHKDKIAFYKSLPSWKEKIDWCHERYIEAMDRAGGIGGTFHGYNSRLKNQSKYTFK